MTISLFSNSMYLNQSPYGFSLFNQNMAAYSQNNQGLTNSIWQGTRSLSLGSGYDNFGTNNNLANSQYPYGEGIPAPAGANSNLFNFNPTSFGSLTNYNPSIAYSNTNLKDSNGNIFSNTSIAANGYDNLRLRVSNVNQTDPFGNTVSRKGVAIHNNDTGTDIRFRNVSGPNGSRTALSVSGKDLQGVAYGERSIIGSDGTKIKQSRLVAQDSKNYYRITKKEYNTVV